MNKKFLSFGAIFIVLASILWSFDGILRYQLRTSLPPINIVFFEHFFGLILLIPVFYIKRLEIASLSKKDWSNSALIGLFPSVLGTLFYTAALGQIMFTPFSVVVLVQQLQPIWAILGAKAILKEKITSKFLFLAILALFGAFLVSFRDLQINFDTNNKTFLAAIFALLASIFWGLSSVFSKTLLSKVSFLTATSLRFLFGTFFSLILMFVLSFNFDNLKSFLVFPLGQKDLSFALSSDQFWQLILVVILTGLGPMLIYYFGLKRTEAKASSIYELTWPISALLIDIFYNLQTKQFGFRPEVFSVSQILGIVILVVSMSLIATQNIENNKLEKKL
jgi:drug/metabolite transporter (DMT)-like permease